MAINTMVKKESPQIHNFFDKLCQQSVFDNFLKYVEFQRNILKNKNTMYCAVFSNGQYIVPTAPAPLLSVNLDITTACNHACTFCVDSGVTNNGQAFTLAVVLKTIDTLTENGLRSVILIGGGEPTLHPDFVEIVRYIKWKQLQLGIVSNGTQPEKLLQVAPSMKKNDYMRFSLDAGVDETYLKIHNPKGKGNSLKDVLCLAKEIKIKNRDVSLGYSFIICWDGITFDGGGQVPENIGEIPQAYQNCLDYNFDYLSLKPCLVKHPEKPVETIHDDMPGKCISEVCFEIQTQIRLAEQLVVKNIPIVQSINLRGMLANDLDRLRSQPKICHAGFFRQVITPFGVYHCPAYRDSEVALIGDALGYASQEAANSSYKKTTDLLMHFDAGIGCKDIACFYNEFNHSIQNLIDSDMNPRMIENKPDQEFFF